MASLTWAVLLLAGLTYVQAIGSPAPIGNLRGIAQIDFRLATTWTQQCVACIVTNYHIVTASSCSGPSQNRRVRVGSPIRGYGGIVREASIIVSHDSADLAVIRVGSSWNLGGPEINNFVLVPQNYFLPPNIPLVIAGWGFTAQGGIIPNDQLYSAVLETKATQACAIQYPGLVSIGEVCVGLAGRPGRDFDPSDAGAPILYEGYLYGVASFGSSASNNENAIVAEAIAVHGPWIRYTARVY